MTKRLPAAPAPAPLEDYAARFDDLFDTLAQRQAFRRYLQGLLLPLFGWPEQERYEEIRPLVLFDVSVAERAAEVGTSKSTLYRRLDRFAEEGIESLFNAPTAKRRRLPPGVRQRSYKVLDKLCFFRSHLFF
jgi:Winged helix-turn helix